MPGLGQRIKPAEGSPPVQGASIIARLSIFLHETGNVVFEDFALASESLPLLDPPEKRRVEFL